MAYHHHFDSDAVCHLCGFDGAEWSHWKGHTAEGKAHPEMQMPICKYSDLDATVYDPIEYEFDDEYSC